jgi:hypothetical protein
MRYNVKADPEKISHSFNAHWKKMSRELPCFGKPYISSREWWSRLVKNTIIDAGCDEKGRKGEEKMHFS